MNTQLLALALFVSSFALAGGMPATEPLTADVTASVFLCPEESSSGCVGQPTGTACRVNSGPGTCFFAPATANLLGVCYCLPEVTKR